MAHIMAVTAYRNAEFGADPGADRAAGTDVAGVGIDDPALLRSLLDQTPTPTALVEGRATVAPSPTPPSGRWARSRAPT